MVVTEAFRVVVFRDVFPHGGARDSVFVEAATLPAGKVFSGPCARAEALLAAGARFSELSYNRKLVFFSATSFWVIILIMYRSSV